MNAHTKRENEIADNWKRYFAATKHKRESENIETVFDDASDNRQQSLFDIVRDTAKAHNAAIREANQ
jgi:predicted restriction endonuclease